VLSSVRPPPHAWRKVEQWHGRREEFDKQAEDTSFIKGLRLVEQAATDSRHFVRKAVNMSLRAIGKRNPELHDAGLTAAQRLAASRDATARWVGKDAMRELTGAAVTRQLHGAT
jgi:3-methyladenine DNA glycosylase AlkD